jgi:hypothetical protein
MEIPNGEGANKLLKPWDFCVIDSKLFLIPDHDAGNIKVYEKNDLKLKLLKVISQKGFGIDDLAEPTYCFYNNEEGKFGVYDFGKREVIIYNRRGRADFECPIAIRCLRAGTEFQLIGNRLLVAGFKRDPNNEPYDLYDINILTGEETFLLLSHEKYGLTSIEQYKAKYRKKSDSKIKAIGMTSLFDVWENDVYFVWEGSQRVSKINIKSGEKISSFGEEVPSINYEEPYLSPGLHNARRNRDFNGIRDERKRMSYVRNIFTNSEFMIVIFDGPVNPQRASNFWVRIYNTKDGGFLKEIPIREHLNHKMCFDKEKNSLYSLVEKSSGKKSRYLIFEYKIAFK